MAAPSSIARFSARVIVVLALAAAALLAWRLRNVLLLLFAAVVLALLLRALSRPIARWTRLPQRWAVGVTALGLAAILGAAVSFFGWSIQAQVADIVDRLPDAWAALQERLSHSPVGARAVEAVRNAAPAPDLGLLAKAQPYLTGFAGAVGNILLVMAGGVYLALDPATYRNGVLRLLPERARGKTAGVLEEVGATLQGWLVAQGLGMAIVGLLTGLGLWAIGVPAPAALGLLTALADFVPLVGPLVAGAVSVLLAVPLGLETAGWTILLFVAVQQLEGNVILPVVQKRIIAVPPVLTLFALVSFGVVFGPLGVLLAVPMTAGLMVTVRGLTAGDASPPATG